MFAIVRVISDIFFVNLSFIIAYKVNFGGINIASLFNVPLQLYFNQLIIITFIYLLIFNSFGLYRMRRGFLIDIDEIIGVFLAVTSAWGILIILTFLRGEYEFSRFLIILSWPFSLILLMLSRAIILRIELSFRRKGCGSRRAAVIGGEALAKDLAKRLAQHPSYGILFVRFLDQDDIKNLSRVVEEHKIDIIFIADQKIARDQMVDLAAQCDELGIDLGSIPDVFSILTASPMAQNIEGLPMVTLKQARFNPFSRFLKRAFDVLLSLFGIIVFSPVMIIITLLIRLTSPGAPAIYAQERVGRGGQTFNLLKFRTMIPDAEAKTGPVLAIGDDPRKTPLGKILRKVNLDELPQLFNILKGDMSFVGPRPERPVFVNQFKEIIPKYMERHKIRPGMAGWAQLHGGYNMPAEEKIKYDLYYIENWSFLLDIKIILKYIQISFSMQREN
jgi:exopolysaccharide biosynthesis polyprenyl glycosylphosphotransferase